MKDILVSIIVPVYNVEQYLCKCIDSIITQTYKKIEIILIDDGSSDSSGIICDEYALKDSRIIVIHKENGGLSSARNAGLDVAIGDYVMFVDSDDFVEPDFCEVPLKIAKEKNVDIVSFGYCRLYADGQIIETKTSNPRSLSKAEGINQLITKSDVIHNYTWNKFYNKNLFKEIRFPIGKYYEDQATTYLLFHKASSIYVIDNILYNYIYRSSSISADWNKPKSIIDRFSIWLERLDFIKEFYPDSTNIQINQLVNEAMKGFFRFVGIPKYRKSVSTFSSFMDNYQDLIIQLRKDKYIRLYYFNKYLFYFYCFYYRFRFLRK